MVTVKASRQMPSYITSRCRAQVHVSKQVWATEPIKQTMLTNHGLAMCCITLAHAIMASVRPWPCSKHQTESNHIRYDYQSTACVELCPRISVLFTLIASSPHKQARLRNEDISQYGTFYYNGGLYLLVGAHCFVITYFPKKLNSWGFPFLAIICLGEPVEPVRK